MSKLNELSVLAYIKGSSALDRAKAAMDEFKNDERGVEGFVVALILIGIAAIAAVAFKDALIGDDGLITKLINKITEMLEL